VRNHLIELTFRGQAFATQNDPFRRINNESKGGCNLLDKLIVRGAREHNLKNVTLEIPRDKLVVFTGLSGSGKTSLAFDTIYAEGQRRYVESLSSYARMFLGQMDKPDIDSIEGLSPAISIDQKTTSRNPRSTVGTVTEVYDYLRLLYARVGVPHCHKCGKEIKQQTVDQMADQIMLLADGTKIQVLAPVVRQRKGEHQKLLEDAQRQGYVRVQLDGQTYELDDLPQLDKKTRHDVSIVIDRLVVHDSDDFRRRLTDSLETAATAAEGLVLIDMFDLGTMLFSQNYACPDCGVSIGELAPRMFSFNSPFGACPECSGLGTILRIGVENIVPDPSKSIVEGALQAMGWNVADPGSMANTYFRALAAKYGFNLNTPFARLPQKIVDILMYGTGDEKITVHYEGANGEGHFSTTFEGVINSLMRRYRETASDGMKAAYEEYMSAEPCPACGGKRLKPEVLAVTLGDKNISDVCDLSVVKSRTFFKALTLGEKQKIIAAQVLKEIDSRLNFLDSVGLSYLTLSRAAGTLSGGEAQRIRLATQIGSSLMGVLYILDEPSIGLHQRDNHKLIGTLKRLRDLGNTLIVVEHDEDTMRAADYIVDVGPGAGVHGGAITAQGTYDEIIANPNSLTGQYLSGQKFIPVPQVRREPRGWLTVKGAREHNLQNIDVRFPMGVFCCVTGVSGSGKSRLVNGILYSHLARVLNRAKTRSGKFATIEGVEQLDKIIAIDQSPIGRTPRSNPATYTGLFDLIRKLFAMTPDAKARGYRENRFSFNVKGGRCEACAGDGLIKIEMHFLPDVYVPCDVCKGMRYNRETLEVRYRGKNIYEVLEMTVEEALEFFEAHQPIVNKLQTLHDVGVGYLKIGQPSTQLSGGEAQRIKLATELSRRATGRTIYLLDEPTTGLHVDDVGKLLEVLVRLVEGGNSVLVIEHNLDVIKYADYVIDLGPEGGDGGGKLVSVGTPEDVAKCKESYTGQYLKNVLERDKGRMGL
jgi:excinuclease ABC subunit A